MRRNKSRSPLLLALGAILIAVEVIATAAVVLSISGDLPVSNSGSPVVVFWSNAMPPLAPTVAPRDVDLNSQAASSAVHITIATVSPTPEPTLAQTAAPTAEPATAPPAPAPAAVHLAPTPAPPPPPTPIPGGYRSDLSDQLYTLLNGERTLHGLAAVSRNDALVSAADFYTQYIFVDGNPYTLDHWLAGGPGDRAWARGYCCAVGEILVESEGDAKGMVDLWMNSDPHRNIILDPQYKSIGVSCYGGAFVGDDGNVHHPIVCAAEFGSG